MTEAPHITFGQRKLYGGSFFNAPQNDRFLTINLMAEHPLPCDIYIPVADYSTPKDPMKLVEAFDRILQDERNVYVGCHGGVGRTGLFMSCFLKYLGEPNPLQVVRTRYNEHAVETEGQMKFLEDFNFLAPHLSARPPRPR